MKKNSDIIQNFMGIFPNTASKEYCNEVIEWFEINDLEGSGGQNNTESRQEVQPGMPKTHKDSQIYWMGQERKILAPNENILVNRDSSILTKFSTLIWKAYDKYTKVYGAALDQLGRHKLAPNIKVQRYAPTQGYHVWHSDVSNEANALRVLVCLLYLNTVKEGGETEFLYQKMRIPPVQGTLVMFPATWTHLHRGNPPLKGNKYVINTWLQFVE